MKNVLLFETTALVYSIAVFLFSTVNCEQILAKGWKSGGHFWSLSHISLESPFFGPPCICICFLEHWWLLTERTNYGDIYGAD